MSRVVRIEITTRDREILETVAEKVRVLSIDQVARTWWQGASQSRAGASRRLGQLEAAGHVIRVQRLARPEIPLDGPLARWRPGRSVPDLTRLSTIARRRFAGPPRVTRFVAASSSTAIRLAGTRIRPLRTAEATHDLHVAAIYLLLRARNPRRARQWEAEWHAGEQRTSLARHNDKLPDAALRAGGRVTAIEFVGQYSTAKLQGFHDFCDQHRYSYELW